MTNSYRVARAKACNRTYGTIQIGSFLYIILTMYIGIYLSQVVRLLLYFQFGRLYCFQPGHQNSSADRDHNGFKRSMAASHALPSIRIPKATIFPLSSLSIHVIIAELTRSKSRSSQRVKRAACSLQIYPIFVRHMDESMRIAFASYTLSRSLCSVTGAFICKSCS